MYIGSKLLDSRLKGPRSLGTPKSSRTVSHCKTGELYFLDFRGCRFGSFALELVKGFRVSGHSEVKAEGFKSESFKSGYFCEWQANMDNGSGLKD